MHGPYGGKKEITALFLCYCLSRYVAMTETVTKVW